MGDAKHMTKIERLEDDISDRGNSLAYRKKFIDALGDPSKWEYTGNCTDLGSCCGHCICGHPIRFEFEIEYQNKKKIVGSECINHFQFINPELYKKLVDADTKMKEKLKELKRLAKEAEQDKEIEKLKGEYGIEYEKFIGKYDSYIKQNQRVPYDLWSARNSKTIKKNPPEYTKKGYYITWYGKAMKVIKKFTEA